jgi:hypothetical protein
MIKADQAPVRRGVDGLHEAVCSDAYCKNDRWPQDVQLFS